MRYAVLVLSSPSAGSCNLTAARFVHALVAAGHSVPRVFFSDAGTQTALAPAVFPQDEITPQRVWADLALSHGTELVVCIASALQHGVLDEAEAKRFAKPATLNDKFTIGGLGLLVDATAAADRVITFGG